MNAGEVWKHDAQNAQRILFKKCPPPLKTKTYVWNDGLKQLLTNLLPYEGLYSSPFFLSQLLSLIFFNLIFFF